MKLSCKLTNDHSSPLCKGHNLSNPHHCGLSIWFFFFFNLYDSFPNSLVVIRTSPEIGASVFWNNFFESYFLLVFWMLFTSNQSLGLSQMMILSNDWRTFFFSSLLLCQTQGLKECSRSKFPISNVYKVFYNLTLGSNIYFSRKEQVTVLSGPSQIHPTSWD